MKRFIRYIKNLDNNQKLSFLSLFLLLVLFPIIIYTVQLKTKVKPRATSPSSDAGINILVDSGGPGDYGFIDGQTYSVKNPIKNTQNQTLYQTERFNMAGYRFDVPNGNYSVTLKFAEIYFMCTSVDCRLFNVDIENQRVLTNFDIIKEAGGIYKAIDKTFAVTVNDGQLNINFTTITNASKISGIQIMSEEGIITPTPTLVPTVTPTQTLPTATPTITAPTSNKNKQGVVFNGPGNRSAFDPITVGASWWYDYIASYGPGNGWVPSVTRANYYADMVKATAKRYRGSYWIILNEPDRSDIGNLTPTQGAVTYKSLRDIILPIDPTAKFIIGGVSTLELSGQNWMKNMALEYKRLYQKTMPMVGYHAHQYLCGQDYSSWTWRKQIEVFKNSMTSAGFTGEFWLTETGCLSRDEWAKIVMVENIEWLKTTPLIQRYAWFATINNQGAGSLLNSNGNLTVLGEFYK